MVKLSQVSWSVTNQGQVDTTESWNDEVVFSLDNIIGNGDDLVVGTVRHSGKLQPGEDYSRSVTVNVPIRNAGRYYLGVQSDRAAQHWSLIPVLTIIAWHRQLTYKCLTLTSLLLM